MRKLLLLPLFLALTMACSSVKVVSTQEKEQTDFEAYRTYNFVEFTETGSSPLKDRKAAIEVISQAISRELESRSLTRAEEADILVNIGVAIEEKVQTREKRPHEGPYYTGQRNYTWEASEVVVGSYREGQITVDLVDSQQKDMVWQGVVSGVLADKPEKNKKLAEEAMNKLFKAYPVKPL